jgi:hypothetical protein
VRNTLHHFAIRRAGEILGGLDQLAFHLYVPVERLKGWAEGAEALPDAYLLKIVDLLHEDDLKALRGTESGPAAEAASPK